MKESRDIVGFQVWSSGLERWEDVVLTDSEVGALTTCHAKQCNESVTIVYRDPLGRSVRYVGPWPVKKE